MIIGKNAGALNNLKAKQKITLTNNCLFPATESTNQVSTNVESLFPWSALETNRSVIANSFLRRALTVVQFAVKA